MKPDNSKIIVHDTKCLHDMVMRAQGSAAPFLSLALRAIDLSTLLSCFGLRTPGWGSSFLNSRLPRRAETSTSTLPPAATASAHSHQSWESTLQKELCKTLQEVFQGERSKKLGYAGLGAGTGTSSSQEIRTTRKRNLSIVVKQPDLCLGEH